MKKFLQFFSLLLLTVQTVYAQSDRFGQNFQPVKDELVKWDPVRGEWLASSMFAMSRHQPVPDRTFPENFTPAEMLRMVPEENRSNVNRIVADNQRTATDTTGRSEWNTIATFVNTPNCRPITGRTYGDPHLSSFDGASYSFQTVGEFVLAKTQTGNMEIQARQQPQTEDISLNTAVAMNVAGDRVCIYANEKPDNISTSALRLNGSPVMISREAYFLPHGGTISYSNNTYIVTWPTGEVANVQLRNAARMNFLNITTQVYPCRYNDMQGLLGNANGNSNDDFDQGRQSPASIAFAGFGNNGMQQASNELEKEYLAFLAKEFANSHRVIASTSLFDYGPGQSTASYTDLSFPRVHHTVRDLPTDRQNTARRICEENGIRGAELNGCIYDQAYVEIPPSPRPVIADRTQGVVLGRVERPTPNVNPRLGGEKEMPNMKETFGAPEPQSIQKPAEKVDKKDGGFPEKVNQTVFPKESLPSGSSPAKGTPAKPTGTISKPAPAKPATPATPAPTKPTTVKPTPAKPTSPPVKSTPIVKPGKG